MGLGIFKLSIICAFSQKSRTEEGKEGVSSPGDSKKNDLLVVGGGGREIQEFKTSSFNPWPPVLSPASAAAAAAAAPKSNPHLKIFRKKYVLHFKFLFCKPVPTRWATFWSPPPSAPYFYLPPLILQVTKEFETRGFSLSGLLLTKCTKN